MEYSTIVDSVVTMPMTLEEFTAYYVEDSKLKPEFALKELQERLVRVETHNTSSISHRSAEHTIACNNMNEGEPGNPTYYGNDGEGLYEDTAMPYDVFVEHVKNLTGPFGEES